MRMIFTISEIHLGRRRLGSSQLAWLALALVTASFSPLCAAAPTPSEALRSAVDGYTPERAAAAKREAADAFFQFESSALDKDLAARNRGAYRELEKNWMDLLATIEAGRGMVEVKAQGERVLGLLESGRTLSEAEGSVFLDSLLIILREGFEAILVISALAAYLRRIGEAGRLPYLYGGSVAAVLASFALWLVARSALELSGSGREALEGWTVLLAAGVLFWVSYWLVSKAEADRWQAFVRSRVDRAVGRGALLGLGFLAFIVVFREGFETVLFYEAVAVGAGGASGQSTLVAGFLTGCGLLAILYVFFQRIGPRIPLRTFFSVTGGLLYFMSFRFAGAGIRELQEAGWVAQTRLGFVPDWSVLSQWLGVFPYLEPLLLQGLVAAAALLAFALVLHRRGQPASGAPAPVEKRHAVAGRR